MNTDADDALIARLRSFEEAYPVDIFTPVTDDDHRFVRENRPGLIDRCSAAMARHLVKVAISPAADRLESQSREIEELRQALRAIITDLPAKRDWLDPMVERVARNLIDAAPIERSGK